MTNREQIEKIIKDERVTKRPLIVYYYEFFHGGIPFRGRNPSSIYTRFDGDLNANRICPEKFKEAFVAYQAYVAQDILQAA